MLSDHISAACRKQSSLFIQSMGLSGAQWPLVCTDTHTQTHRHTDTNTQHTHTQTHTQAHTHRHTHTHKETHTDTQTHTDTDTHTHILIMCPCPHGARQTHRPEILRLRSSSCSTGTKHTCANEDSLSYPHSQT